MVNNSISSLKMFEILRPGPNCVSRILLILFAFFRHDLCTLGGRSGEAFVHWMQARARPPTGLSVGSNFACFLDLEIQKFCLQKCSLCRILRWVSRILLFSVQFDCPCTLRDGIRKMLIWAPVQFCWAVQKFDEKILKPNNKQFDALHSCGQNDVEYLLISCLGTISN